MQRQQQPPQQQQQRVGGGSIGTRLRSALHCGGARAFVAAGIIAAILIVSTSTRDVLARQQHINAAGGPPSYGTLDDHGNRLYTVRRRLQIRDHVVSMFRHGYDSYMTYAYPQDELQPVSCTGTNVFGGYSMTLIDALDMLALVGDDAEFFTRVREVGRNVKFDADLKVSVFETTIRVIGGLLSAHILAEKNGPRLRAESPFPDRETLFAYDGSLLPLAVEIADKLMPAFNTPTAIPFNEIHLRAGVNKADGHTSCPAAAGSLLLEFGLLTQLTGDCKYLDSARRAFLSLWRLRAPHQVVGTMIDIFSGAWINPQTNIGASVDSFFEYMFKAYIAFDDAEYFEMWLDAYKGIQKYTYFGGWYLTGTVEHNLGPISEKQDQQINALQAFWPGLQAIAGETDQALDAYEKMLCVVRKNTFMPEYLHLGAFLDKGPDRKAGPGYPLRPEFLESTYFLQRSTGDDIFFAIAEDFMWSLERAKTKCGYAAILDVFTMKHENKMDSFMLSETLKYLYFIFTPTDDELVKAGLVDPVTKAPPAGATGHFATSSLKHHPLWYNLESGFVVNTEAHPVPLDTDTFATHKRCANADPSFMPLHAKIFMPENGRSFGAVKEDFGARLSFEERRMCPVVDFWRDVAPFIDGVRGRHDAICHRRDFSTRPLRNRGGGGSQQHPARKGSGRPGKVVDPPPPPQQQPGQAEEVAAEDVRTIGLTLPNPAPAEPLPQRAPISLALFQAKKHPELLVEERYGALTISPPIPLNVLHIIEAPVTLTAGRPRDLSFDSAADPSALRAGLPMWGAQFGPSLKDFCNAALGDAEQTPLDVAHRPAGGHSGGPAELPDGFSPSSARDAHIVLQTTAMHANRRTFYALTATWNLCPHRDGTFPRSDLDLRAHVEEPISTEFWLANLTDGTGAPSPQVAPIALLVHRGGCTFKEKAHVAQALGVAAVFIMSNGDTGFTMSDADLPFETSVAIPVVLMRNGDALILQRDLAEPTSAVEEGAVPVVQLVCVNSAPEQLYSLGLVPFYSTSSRRLVIAPKPLVLPSPARSIGIQHLFDAPPLHAVTYGATARHNATLRALTQEFGGPPEAAGFRSMLAVAHAAATPDDATLGALVDAMCGHCYVDLGVAGTSSSTTSGGLAAAADMGLTLHSFFSATSADVGTLHLRLHVDPQDRPVRTILTQASPTEASSVQRMHAPWVHQPSSIASEWKAVMLRQFRLREDVVGPGKDKPLGLGYVDRILAQLHAWAGREGAALAGVVSRYVMVKSATTWVEVVAFDSAQGPQRYCDLAQWHARPDAHDGHVLHAALAAGVQIADPVVFGQLGKFWVQEL